MNSNSFTPFETNCIAFGLNYKFYPFKFKQCVWNIFLNVLSKKHLKLIEVFDNYIKKIH